MNYRVQELRVEIARRPRLGAPRGHEQVVPGYSLDECDPLRGTRVDAPVT